MGYKASTKKSDSEITKTDYWLNVKTPIGNIGVQLAKGIKQHDSILALLNEASVDEINAYLESENCDNVYITHVGNSENKTKSLLDKIKAMKSNE